MKANSKKWESNVRITYSDNLYQYKDYLADLYDTISDEDTNEEKTDTIICCPEPLEFIKYFDNAEDVKASRVIMQNLIDGKYGDNAPEFKKISVSSSDLEEIWFHTTEAGVNLRPGKREDGQVEDVVMLGDDIVHGVVVGRTGSGKSVFLNHLIMTLLHEYAPWELELYLVDLKKVELGRYMSQVYTPHVRTCAATGEIRYIVSMLQHLYKCMQARQRLLAKLGLQKLSAFRKDFKLVLPRVVLIIDEFQQMYQEAKGKEEDEIRELIHSIIKLGRATGFHLLFASQEMQGALNGMELANFKARFALQCDSEVSSMILGNSKAAELPEPGLVLANVGGRHEEQNKEYSVPYINADEDETEKIEDNYFYKKLYFFKEEAEKCGYKKQQSFYHEDAQEEIEKLRDILSDTRVKVARDLKESKRYYDIITLGRGVVYSNKHYDLETFYIERERNKNILAICSDVSDLAYVQKLLATNFVQSPNGTNNLYYNFSRPLSECYDIKKDIQDVSVVSDKEELERISQLYISRCAVREAVKEKSKEECKKKYAEIMYKRQKKNLGEQEEAEEESDGKATFWNHLSKNDNERVEYYYQKYNESKEDLFSPINIWISGVDYIEGGLPKQLDEILEKGMDVNMMFLLFASSDNANYVDSSMVRCCEYLFAKGKQESIYNKLQMNFDRRSKNDIAIDFKIKSLNTERAFKKYRTQFDEFEAPKLDFDRLLSEEE